jgi:8-oxo-dGTP diphosphatase
MERGAAVVAVGAVVFDAGGRVLLVRRGRPPGAGTWSLPGGRVDSGEALGAAVTREVREETGLDVDVVRELEAVEVAREGYRYRIHEHLCRVRDEKQELRAGDDAADARWATLDELPALGVRDDAVRIIARARAG